MNVGMLHILFIKSLESYCRLEQIKQDKMFCYWLQLLRWPRSMSIQGGTNLFGLIGKKLWSAIQICSMLKTNC